MNQSTLHSITNDYQDVRLVSLKGWKRAHEVSPRDNGGPYVVIQEGRDPEDLEMDYDEFLLGKSGKSSFNVDTLRKQSDQFIEACLEKPGDRAINVMATVKG
jgi:hypothetical protein